MTDLTSTLESTSGDAAAVIEAARASTEVSDLVLGQIYAAPQADGSVRLIDLDTDDHRARIAGHPVRKTGTVKLTEHASLSQYVTAHAEAEATTLWADRDAGTIVAILNDHEANVAEEGLVRPAGWRDHRATLTLRQTPAWKAWVGMDGKVMNQVAFAEFLEDHLADIVEPDGAHLLEVASSIEATKGVAMKNAVRLDSGEVKVRYEETIDARAGQQGELTIPTRVTLGIAPFEGVDPYRIDARIRFRLGEGRLTLSYVLDRPEDVLRAAFGDIVTQFEAATGLTVLYGAP